MFRIFFTNLGYYSFDEGRTLDEALKIARSKGRECRIESPDRLPVATWCPIMGYKPWS